MQIFANGVSIGAVLFLMAAGLSLLIGAMGVLNLAHGAVYMVGAYIGWMICVDHGLPFPVAVLGAGVGAAVIGLGFERLFHLIQGQADQQILLSFGLVYVLVNLSQWIWGAVAKPPFQVSWLSGAVHVGSASIPVARLAIAVIGLIINIVGIKVLSPGADESLNVKGAYFEVLSDLVSSVGVILAAVVMWTTGWRYADPLVSAGIGLFIVPRTWALLRQAVGILLEGTPSDVNIEALRGALSEIPGISDVHDLHVWSLSSGVNAMSAHVVRAGDASSDDVLRRACDCVVRTGIGASSAGAVPVPVTDAPRGAELRIGGGHGRPDWSCCSASPDSQVLRGMMNVVRPNGDPAFSARNARQVVTPPRTACTSPARVARSSSRPIRSASASVSATTTIAADGVSFTPLR